MTAGELIVSAERCEATAKGQFRVITEAGMAVWGWGDPRYKRLRRLCEEGAFLDAAMTLVPEEREVQVERWPSPSAAHNGARATAWVQGASRVYAATLALALTAACLRAWASLTEAPSNLASKSEERDDG